MKAYKARQAKQDRRKEAEARNEAYDFLSLEDKIKTAGAKEKTKLLKKVK